jgi:hypothetical protein
MADYVLVEKTQGVAIITMNRPAQLNAMSRQLSAELHDAVTEMSADDEVGLHRRHRGGGSRVLRGLATFTSSARTTASTRRRSSTPGARRASATDTRSPPAPSRPSA